MPSSAPQGVLAPADGHLPQHLVAAAAYRPLSAYVHIPFCSSRCGYCDFTTYTPAQLRPLPATDAAKVALPKAYQGEAHHSGHVSSYVQAVLREVALAKQVVPHSPPLSTVFFGGGTPTLLPVEQLGAIVQVLRETFGLASDAEITTEANPETLTPAYLEGLLQAGFTRLSVGMQSVVPHVLQVLERRHNPQVALQAVGWARQAGFEHISLDVIYGTPGESDDDWLASLQAAAQAPVDHISAYGLIVEPGTRLAAQVRRGVVPDVDDDVLASRYEQCDNYLSAHGFSWYEVSNWARGEDASCRHNLAYWRGDNWWGFGTGAHSHLGLGENGPQAGLGGSPVAALRWWNVRHPGDYAQRLAGQEGLGPSPAAGRELLGIKDVTTEQVMLGLRLAQGLPMGVLPLERRAHTEQLLKQGLVQAEPLKSGRLVLTFQGRLLADAVIRDLVP